jgi:hypothetical protein
MCSEKAVLPTDFSIFSRKAVFNEARAKAESSLFGESLPKWP